MQVCNCNLSSSYACKTLYKTPVKILINTTALRLFNLHLNGVYEDILKFKTPPTTKKDI